MQFTCITCSLPALHAVYLHYMQFTCITCSLPALHAVYLHYMQFTCITCSLPALHAVYLHYMQFTCITCSLPALHAVYLHYMQFTCITCSLPVKTGKFTCVEAASTSHRIHANCLQAHVNLPEYHGHFRSNFTCGTHANLPATSMQKCFCRQKYMQPTGKNTRIAGKITRQTQANIIAKAGKITHIIAGKKKLQFHTELPAIASNLLSHRG